MICSICNDFKLDVKMIDGKLLCKDCAKDCAKQNNNSGNGKDNYVFEDDLF